MAYPPNELFSAFAFIGFVLCMIPLPFHLQAYNVGTCAFMIWVGLGCLNQFINAVVWNHNAILRAPAFCDLSVKIIIAMNVAIPICSLIINRRLYFIATSDTVTSSRIDRRRAMIFDLSLAIGVPIIQMILAYIPQGNRFDIYEDLGCNVATYNSWVSIVLINVPPVLIGCVSAVYCTLTIIAFNKRRLQFKEVLSGHSNLSSNRYFRLMFMAGVDILCTVPLGVWVLVLNIKAANPWAGWDSVHADFGTIYQFPALFWRSIPGAFGLELERWLIVFAAWVFFAVFGIHAESRKNYRTALNSIAQKLGSTTSSFFGGATMNDSFGSKFSTNKGSSLPVFDTRRKRGSVDSFTNMSMSQASDLKKSFAGDTSFGAFSFADLGGALSEKEKEAEAESPSTITSAPGFPEDIEISSVYRASVVEPISIPSRTLDIMNVPREGSPTSSHPHDMV